MAVEFFIPVLLKNLLGGGLGVKRVGKKGGTLDVLGVGVGSKGD